MEWFFVWDNPIFIGGVPLLFCFAVLFLLDVFNRSAAAQVKGRAPGSSDQRSTDPANGSTGEANP